MIRHKHSEVLHYFVDVDTNKEYITENGVYFYNRNKSKVYKESLIKSLQECFSNSKYAMIIFENVEDFTVPIDKFSYTIENGIISEISFRLSDTTFVNVFDDCSLEQRLTKYKDIVGIRLNGTTYWTAWNEEHDEYNIYQRNIIHGDFVKIKFVGDE